jgi:hypothetical protein
MGGTQSTISTIEPIKYEKEINIITHVEENEEEIFSKISDLTKEILIKYSDMHLDENFCNNLAIIYEDKLNTFKIKLLRSIYNKISAKKIQHELLLVNKYADRNDDKFKVEDDLKVGIEELFFNQNIKFNPTYLSQIELFDPNINIQDIFKKTITNKKYIDDTINFNDLLNNKSRFQRNKKFQNNGNKENENKEEENKEEENNQDEEDKNSKNNNSQLGGANNYLRLKNNRQIRSPYNKQKQLYQQRYNKPFKQPYNKSQKQQYQQARYNKPQQIQNNSQKYIKPYKEQAPSFQNSNIQVQYKNQQEQLNKLSSNNELASYQPKKINNINQPDNQPSNQPGNQPSNQRNNRNNDQNNNENNEVSNILSSIQQSNNLPSKSKTENQNMFNNNLFKISELINSHKETAPSTNKNIEIAKLKQNLNNARREKNLLLQQQKIEYKVPKEPFNTPYSKKNNIEQKPNLSQQKFKNIYSVPKNFKVKNPCSTKAGDCYLNKRQICELISQHFIVRNNIIAAILSCIPRKVGNNYEGGICYQQFINLNNCKVCIPENYKDLLNSNNKNKNKDKTLKFIQDIATASLNLTKEACKENNGTYYNLSKSQEIALVDKAKTNKMNSFFFICRKKIKEVYLENLKLLIEILNKLNETPVINNATLNIISNDTKTIIDKMYTLCQYYYIYAIISLLNSDITSEEKTKKNFFKKNIKEFV